MTLHIKNSGSWREVKEPFVNVDGTWKTVREVHVKHGGSWREAHVTPYTAYSLGPYVVEESVGVSETGSYTIPTGQGIGYIQLYVEGQAGGGGGGTYTPEYWPCSGNDVNTNAPTTSVFTGGTGGLGGTITNIHRVLDGDYITWTGYSEGYQDGDGAAGFELYVTKQAASYTGYAAPGTYSTDAGENGFMLTCSIRDSTGSIKSQMNAGGGRGGIGSTISHNSSCTGSGISSGFRGFNISGTNGATGASGQASNAIVAGSGSVSVVQGDGTITGGAGGNAGSTITNSGTGVNAQNISLIKIKLYTPNNY